MLEEHDICLISLRQNDAGAWKIAFEALWKVAWRTAKRKLCYDSPEQIEDIVSQVVGKEIVPQIVEPTQTAFVKAETFQDVVNITVRVVSNRVIDEIRRRTRLPEESSISKVSESEFVNGTNEQKQELNDAIHSAIESLDQRYRDVLYAHYFDGFSTQEIAEKFNRPKGTICTDLVTARQMLESLLAEKRQKMYG